MQELVLKPTRVMSEEQSFTPAQVLNFAVPTIYDSPHGSAINHPLRVVTEEKTSASFVESPLSELDFLTKLIEDLSKLMSADLRDKFLKVPTDLNHRR